MGRHLSELTNILGWSKANLFLVLISFLSAGSAMTITTQASDLAGFSSVLIVGAIALLAGHAWGIAVIAASELLLLGKTWPIVNDSITNGTIFTQEGIGAAISALSALPGLALFIFTLPFIVEVVIGQKGSAMQRPGELLSSFAAALWLLLPLAPLL